MDGVETCGTSFHRSIFFCHTAPIAPPNALRLRSGNQNVIFLTWDPVPLAYRNGKVDAYEVTYSSFLNTTTSDERRVNELSYVLAGSLELTTYTFSVRAVVTTDNGEDLFGPYGIASIIHDCKLIGTNG